MAWRVIRHQAPRVPTNRNAWSPYATEVLDHADPDFCSVGLRVSLVYLWLHLHYYPNYLASERELPWINGT